MFRRVPLFLKSHKVRTVPRHAAVEELTAPQKPMSTTTHGRWRLRKPVVLDGLDAALPPSMTTASTPLAGPSPSSSAAGSTAADVDVSSGTAQHLWAFSRVLRASRDARRTHGACVVGGASAIRRVWREYGIQPTVVYVPETEATVPSWCLEDALPSVVVRCPPVQVKRSLLSAEHSDGYAAEFPCASETRLPPVYSLLTTQASSDDATHHGNNMGQEVATVSSMVVLVGLRIPSNVGLLIRAAVDLGFERVVLINCTDPFHEKVLRASDGTVLSPRLTLHEMRTSSGDGGVDGDACVRLLSAIAAQHRLLPLLAVPSQEAEPAFEVARAFHRFNRQCTAPVEEPTATWTSPQTTPWGPMVVLGSESQGLRALDGHWSVPYQMLSLPVPNTAVDSFNVGVAGSIVLNLFRPGAAAQFIKLRDAAGEVDSDEDVGSARDGRTAAEVEAGATVRGVETPPENAHGLS